MRGGVLQLQRWGLLDQVVATGTPPVRRVTFHYGGEPGRSRSGRPPGSRRSTRPRRTVLDAVLVDAAEEAGARFRFGWP